MNFDYAVHSDFLIHWTGVDIDERDKDNNLNWCKPDEDKSKTTKRETESYIKRLYDILQFGLWMTVEDVGALCFDGTSVSIPNTPRTCFTELKVSESRKHARQYGRLGIGVKRPFVFKQFGRPLIYYGFHEKLNNDKFLRACAELDNKDLLNFFKPMNRSNNSLTYDFYAESEWRILFFKELLEKKLIIDPRDTQNKKENDYFMELSPEEQAKLKYLIPLNYWLAMIIHPSLDVKNKARQDELIRQEIENVKAKGKGNKAEAENWPIEVDLDACRNF